jgi:hypothetical protein
LLHDLHFLLVWHIINSLNMCWILNHQNIIEMAEGHISLSVSHDMCLSLFQQAQRKLKKIPGNKFKIIRSCQPYVFKSMLLM